MRCWPLNSWNDFSSYQIWQCSDHLTCASCNFDNILSVLSQLWPKYEVRQCIAHQKTGNQNLEQRFSMKLGKSANETCVMFSEAYGTEATNKSSVLEWCNKLQVIHNEVTRGLSVEWKMLKEVVWKCTNWGKCWVCVEFCVFSIHILTR